jgi:hypothetical protein
MVPGLYTHSELKRDVNIYMFVELGGVSCVVRDSSGGS